jgi:LAO/AO transport system kinase
MIDELAQRVLSGDRRALARLLTYVENEREGVETALAVLFPHTGSAWMIGVTGAPGTGKSTLVSELAKVYRAQGKTVAILAVDPTSPFSGGAILGDRIRMRDLSGDSGIFIRSMATRGNLGGLARAARDAVRVMDAAGFERIMIETVGAGQSEVDIARMAQTTLVVEAPGLGDDVQAIKAGILEIADVLVVNKIDRPGAVNTVRSLKAMLELGHPAQRSQLVAQTEARHHGRLLPAENSPETEPSTANGSDSFWMPPIVETIASEGKGIADVVAAVEAHHRHLTDSNLLTQLERQQIEIELYNRLRDTLMARFLNTASGEQTADFVERIQRRELDPQSAVQEILDAQPSHATK